MTITFRHPFPEFFEDDSVDKASGRSKKSNEAAAGKDGRGTQKLPSSQKNSGGKQPEMSSCRIAGVTDTNAKKQSKQPGPDRKSDDARQNTRKHDVPSPSINRSNEGVIGGKKPETKSYSSPDSRNLMEVVLKIRQHCQEGCPRQTKKFAYAFPGVKSVEVVAGEGQVKVTGTMKVEELVSHLQKNLKREVVLVPVKNVINRRDAEVSAVEKALKKSEEVGGKRMPKGENVNGGRDVRSHKVSKRSKGGSRVHLDGQTKMNPDLPQIKTQSGINGDTMHDLENSMEGRRRNKVTKLKTFGLTCDEDYLQKAQETAMNFEGVESAKIDMSKGLIVVTGAVDQKKLETYLKEILKREVLEVRIQRNDIPGDRNKLNDGAARCGGDKYKHTGADEVNMKEVAVFSNVNGAWRKDKPGEVYTDIGSMYLQNYPVDPQFGWMSPTHQFVSPFSDEVVSRDEQDTSSWWGWT